MCLTCFAVALVPFFSGQSATPDQTIHYEQPVDALSVEIQTDNPLSVRGRENGTWTDWQLLTIDNEQDPTLLESNLVMFDVPVTDIQIRGDFRTSVVHPIRISDAPVAYKVSATTRVGTPRILTRDDWGADESLLYVDSSRTGGTANEEERLPAPTASSGTPSKREIECAAAQKNYPQDFQTVNKVTKGENGKLLRWANTYSKKIKQLVVHHTAVQVTGEQRSGAERMRALYQYHSVNRGWGDIGYHYMIDETGQIYEGKSGGPFVVAGHAYCNNAGTIGIALMGNFEEEPVSQMQVKSLQWLLDYLATTYDVDVSKNVSFHGKSRPAIVGHGDLLDTACPGYYVNGLMDQIRTNVRSGNIDADVKLLPLRGPVPVAPVTPASPGRSAPIPEETSEDLAQNSGSADRLARLQRKIRASVRLSARVGGRASQLADTRNATTIRQTAPVRKPVTTRTVVAQRPATASAAEPVSPSSSVLLRVRLTSRDAGLRSCDDAQLSTLGTLYRGSLHCEVYNGAPVIINTVDLEEYMMGLAEEPDTEPYEKQRAFAIAARTYAAWYTNPQNRKFPGAPYDGSDSPATFQKYNGKSFETKNPNWVKAVTTTTSQVLKKGNQIIKPPYFSSDAGRTLTPKEAGWGNSFPFAEIFTSKEDPWCKGMPLNGHGVGMSGCGSKGMAKEGKTGEDILQYYYPGTVITPFS